MKFNDLENSTKIILKVVFVVLVLAFLWEVREVIAILLMAIILASAMEPLADYLHAKKVPRGVSVFTVYAIVLVLVGLVISSVLPPVIEQFKLLATNLPSYIADFQSKYPSFAGIFGNGNLSSIFSGLVSGGDNSTVFSKTVSVFSSALGFVTVLVISFYLVVSKEKGMKDFVGSIVPASRREQVLGLVTKIQKKMGLWLLGQLILSIIIFVFTFIGLTILGVKYALVLALIAGLLEVVPYIGPILSAIPALFFAFIQNPALGIGVVILYVLIQKTEGYVLVPKIMEKTVGTSPLVVLLSLLVGFKLAGIIGLLLAVPLAGALMVVIEEFTGNEQAVKET